MATFNPGSQDETQQGYNPLMWTKSVEAPKGSEAGKFKAQATGGLAAGLAEFGKDTQQNWLKGSLYNEMEPVREEYQRKYDQQLAGLENDSEGSQIVPPKETPEQSKTDIVSEGLGTGFGGGMPTEQKKAMTDDLASVVGAGPTHANKLRPLDYDARIAMVATRWRNQWPGERELIDEEVNKFTGRGIANKVLRDTMQRINDLQAQHRAGMSEGLGWFEKPDTAEALPGGLFNQAISEYVNSGGNKAVLAKWIMAAAPYEQEKARLQRWKLYHEYNKETQTDNDENFLKRAVPAAQGMLDAQINTLNTGGNKDTSPVIDHALGGGKPNPEAAAKLTMQYRQQALTALNNFDKIWQSLPPEKRPSPEAVEKGHKQIISNLEDQLKALGTGNLTALTYSQEVNSARSEGALTGLYERFPGLIVQGAKAFRLLDPTVQAAVQESYLPEFKKDKNLGIEVNDLGVAQLHPDGDGKLMGQVQDAIIEESRTKGQSILTGLTLNANNPKILKDPKAVKDLVDNIASGQIRFNRYASSHIDPNTGRRVPGAEHLFAQIFNPRLIEAAKREGLLPILEKAAKDYSVGGIFKNSYNNLTDDNYGLKAHWDEVNKKIHFLPDPDLMSGDAMSGVAPMTPDQIPTHIKDAEDNINMQLGVMKNFADLIDPSRVDEYLVEAMVGAGANFSKLSFDNTLGGQFVQAFRQARQAAQEAEEKAQKESESPTARYMGGKPKPKKKKEE